MTEANRPQRTLRIRWRKLGGHYHCRLFIGVPGQTFANVGECILDEVDWVQIETMLRHSHEFINEG